MHQHVLVEVLVINLRAVFALVAKRASGFSVEIWGDVCQSVGGWVGGTCLLFMNNGSKETRRF